ncbi:MAG: SufD family Fe-S cluster assembly protein [Candidatus Dependentiae bacterium]|nr:SufD family Fe-S cluster assembly protein [Candidatus Dependentiae bacterium]
MSHQLNFYDPVQKINVAQNDVLHARHAISGASQKIDVVLEQGSQCTFHVQDEYFSEEQSTIEYHFVLEKNAQLDFLISLIESCKLSVVIYVYLQGDGAQASIKGIYALDGDQNISIKTFQYHTGPRTKSELALKGMLKGRAQALYEGLIFIGEQAKKTEASQENKNILLSKQAKVISIPSIEVLQHDVQCSHGSAIGKFDDEQLWYLQSRGLSKPKAYELLIESFFKEIVVNFEDEKVMEKLCQKMI